MLTATQKTQVVRWVRKWRTRLLLDAWTVNVQFEGEPDPQCDPGSETYASVLTSHRYMEMRVYVFPPFWSLSRDEQERTLVHELSHGPADHTKALILRRVAKRRVTPDEATDANERLVEWIANVAWKAYR